MEKTTRQKIKEVFQLLDGHLLNGDYNTVDNILSTLDTNDINIKVLIGYLSITNPWKNELKSRGELLDKIEIKLLDEVGETRTDNILKGLR